MERTNGNTTARTDKKGLGWGWASVIVLGILGIAVTAGLMIGGTGERGRDVARVTGTGDAVREAEGGAAGSQARMEHALVQETGGAESTLASSEEPCDEGGTMTAGSYKDAETAYFDGRYEAAAAQFSALASADPRSVMSRYMLGLSLWKDGRPVEAETAFRDALAVNPAHVKSLVNLARVLVEQGRASDALPFTARAVGIDPNDGDAQRVRGRAFHTLGVPDEAIASYERAIALDPDDAWALNNLGLVLIESGRYDDAIGPLARATRVAQAVPLFQNNLGIALERTGHFGAAKESYARALEIDSSYSKAAENLARVAVLKEDPSLAAIDLDAAAEGFRTITAATAR
jgi:Tfp pilus assembly protein PilF